MSILTQSEEIDIFMIYSHKKVVKNIGEVEKTKNISFSFYYVVSES